nr:hypothetical protein [uncultured Christiangramia sp.]
MKRFEIYKNIRKQAVIFGLSISLFAVMMISILASLLVIIFSFGSGIIILVFVGNLSLYIVLSQIKNNPQLFAIGRTFPKIISNKRNTHISYGQD